MINTLMIPLTSDEQRLFNTLRDYLDVHGHFPTIREWQDAMGMRSRLKLQTLRQALREKGYIDWVPGRSRCYQLLVNGVPVWGMIQAGIVVEHPTDQVEWVELPGIPCRSKLYALRVCGDSMINAHICEGDLVILKPQPDLWSLKRDAIAVVWVEGSGATLKYIEFDGKSVFLKPANPNYPVYQTTPDQIVIQGVVISVHRHYGD